MKKTALWIIAAIALLACGPAHAAIDLAPLVKEMQACQDPARLKLLQWKLEIIKGEFPHSQKAALQLLAKAYPRTTPQWREDWLASKSTISLMIDGQRRYFADLVKNAAFRNFELIRATVKKKGKGSPFFDQVEDLVFRPAKSGYQPQGWQPYVNPMDFMGEMSLRIPKKDLPAKGLVKLWLPLPIQTGCQVNPRLVSITPAQYVKTVARMDGDFGFIYLEIPMAKLKGDLDCRVKFLFTHYEQRFRVDPKKVLPYDQGSALYKFYTRSYGNTAITPAIAEEARRVTGGEKNPYLAAQKIYDHIVKNYPYSHVPHTTLQILGLAEAPYVQQYGHGDCGAQSMLFSAMCRAVGIPARTSGGYQIMPGLAGTHFWAEFFVQGYGWIPTDVTVAEAGDWSGLISEEQRRRFKAYYFGNQDPYRMVIQKDVDLPLSPWPEETPLTDGMPPIVVQNPFIVCPQCATNPYDLVDKGFKIKLTPLGN